MEVSLTFRFFRAILVGAAFSVPVLPRRHFSVLDAIPAAWKSLA